MRLVWLGMGLMPYVIFAGIDTWLHERSRRVPRIEQMLHAGLAISLIVFVTAVFSAWAMLALIALCMFVVLEIFDEFGFHRHLDARERRIHFAAYVALLAFVLTWRWMGDGP